PPVPPTGELPAVPVLLVPATPSAGVAAPLPAVVFVFVAEVPAVPVAFVPVVFDPPCGLPTAVPWLHPIANAYASVVVRTLRLYSVDMLYLRLDPPLNVRYSFELSRSSCCADPDSWHEMIQ